MDPKNYVVMMLEEHHRRPRSVGGDSRPTNLSYVPSDLHRSWHAMFGNFNVFQIVERLNQWVFWDLGREVYPVFINGSRVYKTGQNACKEKKKFLQNWEIFLKKNNGDLKYTINYINNVWLDPAYHLYIKRKRKKKVKA